MLSRVADSLYWMSRSLERAEHTARALDIQLNLALDEAPWSSSMGWLCGRVTAPLSGLAIAVVGKAATGVDAFRCECICQSLATVVVAGRSAVAGTTCTMRKPRCLASYSISTRNA